MLFMSGELCCLCQVSCAVYHMSGELCCFMSGELDCLCQVSQTVSVR